MKKTTIYARKRTYSTGYGEYFTYVQINAYGCEPRLPEGYEQIERHKESIDHVFNQVGDIKRAVKFFDELEEKYNRLSLEAMEVMKEMDNIGAGIGSEMWANGVSDVIAGDAYLSIDEDGKLTIKKAKVL